MPANSDPPANGPEPPLSRARERGSGGEGSLADEVALIVALPDGIALHARPAADLVRAASKLQTPVTVSANGKRANARSILEVLALGAVAGTELTLSASGPGAAEAVQTLAEVFASLGS
ncbi:MAG TPA: HPr family phosphocarrier protein [Chloroflexota bacterium]|nr:HPr family phosphocarrier protein [Chloroflexota bacterium]